VIIISVVPFIFAKDTPRVAKIEDPRAGFLPGFHDTMVSLADTVNNLVMSASENLRTSFYSFKENNARYLTDIPKGIQVSYFNQLNNIDFESLIDYGQSIALYCLYGFVSLILVILWIFGTCIYQCVCCCKCCCGKKQENYYNELKRKDYVQWKVKMDKNYKCHLGCRIFTWIWLCITLCLLVVWIIFAEQTSIEVSNTITAVVDASETFEGVVIEAFEFVQDIQNLEYTFHNCTDIINYRIIQKLPTSEQIENVFTSIDDIEHYLPNTTNIKQFLVDVNFTINSIPDLDMLSQRIDLAKTKVEQIKFVHLSDIYNEVDSIDMSIDSSKNDLDDLESSVNEAKTVKGTLPDMGEMKSIANEYDEACEKVTSDNIDYVTSTDFGNIPDHVTLKSKLQDIKEGVDKLKNINAETLTNGFTSMKNAKENMPDPDSIGDKVISINSTLSGININHITVPITETNNTINELRDLTTELSDIVQEVQSSITTTPEFEVVFVEFNKTTTIKEKLWFMDEIFNMTTELNNSVLILPNTIWDMIDDFEDKKNQFLNGSQLSDMENQLMELNKTMSDSIPELSEKLDEVNLNETIDKLPDLNSMTSDLDGGQEKLENSLTDLDANGILSDMEKFKTSLDSIPDLTEHNSKIIDMKGKADNINTGVIGAVIALIDSECGGPPPCSISHDELDTLKTQLSDLGNAMDNRPTDLKTQMESTDDAINDIPDLNVITTKIDNARTSMQQLPDLKSIKDDIRNSNNSIDMDEMPFDSMKDQVSEAKQTIEDIPDINTYYEQVDQMNVISQMKKIKEPLDGFRGAIRSFMEYLGLMDKIKGQVESVFDQIENYKDQAIGYVETYQSYKKTYVGEYVYKYDYLRLWVCLALIMLVILIPLMSVCGTCCYYKCNCCNLLMHNVMIIFSIVGFLLLAFILPVNIFMGDHCNDNYISTQLEYAINNSSFVPENIRPILQNGYSFNQEFQGIKINVSIPVSTLIMNYLLKCPESEDPMLGLMNTTKDIKENLFDMMKSYADTDFGQGVKIHPNVFETFDDIRYELRVVDSLIDTVGEMVSCPKISGIYRTAKDLICVKINGFIILLWLSLVCIAILFWIGSVWGCSTHCHLHCYYWYNKHSKKAYMPMSPVPIHSAPIM